MKMENIKEAVKTNIVQNFFENAKPEFARRGASHQRPKKFGKGGKSGTERTQARREGKKAAQQMDESFFDMGPDGVTRGLGRNWGVEKEDSPDWRMQQAIRRMESQRKWAMARLMPLYEKHGMAEQHAGTTDEYGFPAYGHAVSHPGFRGFVNDFIAFHTEHNQQHWKEHGRASPYHWPAILRARQGLDSLRRMEEYNAKQQNNPGGLSESAEELEAELGGNQEPHQLDLLLKRIRAQKAAEQAAREQAEINENYDAPGDISEEWENREQQRMYASHEVPMIPGGERGNYGAPEDAQEILDAEGRRELAERHPLVPQWFIDTVHRYAGEQHGDIKITGALTGVTRGMVESLMLASEGKGKMDKAEVHRRTQEILQHHSFANHVLEGRHRMALARLKDSSVSAPPAAGDIPF